MGQRMRRSMKTGRWRRAGALTALVLSLAVTTVAAAPAAAAPPPPEITIAVTAAYPDGAPAVAQTAITLTLNAPRAKQMRFSNDGGLTWSVFETYAATKAWDLAPGPDGPRTVTAQFVDNKGALHTAADDTLLDTVAPWTASAPESDDAYYNAPVALTFGDWGDAEPSSGVAAFQYRLPGEDWTTVLTPLAATIVWLDPAALADGEHEVQFRALDGAGNPETAAGGAEPRAVARRTDTTAPVTTEAHDDDSWHNAPFEVTLEAIDALAGVAGTWYSLDGGLDWAEGASVAVPVSPDHADDGLLEVLYYSADAAVPAGNAERPRSFTVRVDTAAPAATIDAGVVDLEVWQNRDVELAIRAADAQVSGPDGAPLPNSGVARVEHRVDGGEWTEGDTMTLAALSDHSADGVHVVEARAVDAAGNVGEAARAEVAIDTAAPTLRLPLGGWWRPGGPFAVAAADELAGVALLEYRLDGADWAAYEGPFTIAGEDGSAHLVEVRAVDAAGNETTVESVEVTLDGAAPVTTMSGAGAGWNTTPVTLLFTGVDELSGVGVTEYSLDGGATWTAGTSLELAASAVVTVLYRSADLVGNVEQARAATVKVDLVGPRTAGKAASVRVGVAVRLRYKGTDDVSGKLSGVRLVVKDGKNRIVKRFSLGTRSVDRWYSVKWTPAKKGTYRYFVYAKDEAGLKQSTTGSAKVVVR